MDQIIFVFDLEQMVQRWTSLRRNARKLVNAIEEKVFNKVDSEVCYLVQSEVCNDVHEEIPLDVCTDGNNINRICNQILKEVTTFVEEECEDVKTTSC